MRTFCLVKSLSYFSLSASALSIPILMLEIFITLTCICMSDEVVDWLVKKYSPIFFSVFFFAYGGIEIRSSVTVFKVKCLIVSAAEAQSSSNIGPWMCVVCVKYEFCKYCLCTNSLDLEGVHYKTAALYIKSGLFLSVNKRTFSNLTSAVKKNIILGWCTCSIFIKLHIVLGDK